MKDEFLQPEKIHQYSHDIWVSLKKNIDGRIDTRTFFAQKLPFTKHFRIF